MISTQKIKEEANHNLKMIVVAVLFALIAYLLTGCSEAKKSQKAVNRVKADINLLLQVGEAYRQLKPCANDTITEFIHDSTTTTVIKEVVKKDTIVNGDTVYIITSDTIYSEKTKTIFKEKIITDKELTNRQKDTINSLRVQHGVKDGVIQELRGTISTLKKEKNNLKWYLAGSFLLLILSHIVRSYLPKIKLPFLKS